MAIAVECECGRRFKVRDELAGRKIKCPECGDAVRVPDAGDGPAVAAGPPKRPARRPDDDYDDEPPRRRSRRDEDDEDDDRPRRKQKSNKGLIIGLSAGGGVLLIGGIVLIIILTSGGGDNKRGGGPGDAAFFPGPGAGPGPGIGGGGDENHLQQIGLAYHNYHDAAGRGPSKAEDLLPFLENSQALIAPLKDGRIVFIYNVRILEMIEGTSNTILAYERDAPTRGGLVLLGDGSVRRVGAGEFASMPKAQPKKK